MRISVILIWGFIALFFTSCSMDQAEEEYIDGGDIMYLEAMIAITDHELQDCLNPESPSYFGETYTDGIEVLYLYEGRKITVHDLFRYVHRLELPENYQVINPPYRMSVAGIDLDTLFINQGTHDYHFIDVSPGMGLADEDNTTYTFIRYPDGKEDEVKTQIFYHEHSKGSITLLHKIWINNEPVYAMSKAEELSRRGLYDPTYSTDDYQAYYNPSYYPWMEPVLDDDGNQIGTLVRPKEGTRLIVVKK
jgi:hypothetical protein